MIRISHLRAWLLFAGLAVSAQAQTAVLVPSATSLKPGEDTVTFAARVTYAGQPAAVGWCVVLPEGWAYVGGKDEPEVRPEAGQTAELEWACIEIPAGQVAFTFTVRRTAAAAGPHLFTARVLIGDGDDTRTIEVEPVRIR